MKTKPRNPVVRDQIANPKRNAGRHSDKDLRMTNYMMAQRARELEEYDRWNPTLQQANTNKKG